MIQDWYVRDDMEISSELWRYVRDDLRRPVPAGNGYIFKGSKYYRTTLGSGVDSGYPKSLSDHWDSWIENCNAAVRRIHGRKERYYFFKGSKYLRWTRGEGVDSGYPREISSTFNDSFINDGIDAALNIDNSRVLFFRGGNYIVWRWPQPGDPGFPGGSGTRQTGPRSIGDVFDSEFDDGIDGAMNRGDGKAYLYKGDRYLRFTVGSGVDSGYPKTLSSASIYRDIDAFLTRY
jgi:hypothetical protein